METLNVDLTTICEWAEGGCWVCGRQGRGRALDLALPLERQSATSQAENSIAG